MMHHNSNLQRLPVELRNRIYELVVDEVTDTMVYLTLDTPDFDELRPRIPLCLQLNHQIVNEATRALRHHTITTATKLRIPNAAYLLCKIPSKLILKQVCQLEIMQVQDGYGQARLDKSTWSTSQLQDLVTRCPELREFTFPIKIDVVLAASDSPSRLKTPQELVTTTGFDLLCQHEKLEKLNLICREARTIDHSRVITKDYTDFLTLESWLLEEARARGRNIALDIELSPGARSNSGEHVRRRVGCITWMEYHDWFG